MHKMKDSLKPKIDLEVEGALKDVLLNCPISVEGALKDVLLNCPICEAPLHFPFPWPDPPQMLISCENSECDWYYGMGALREAVMKALHGTTD